MSVNSRVFRGLSLAVCGFLLATASLPAAASPTANAEASLLAQLSQAQGAREMATSVSRGITAPPLPAESTRTVTTTADRRALEPMAEAAAQQHGLTVSFFKRLIRQESGYNPLAVSHAGAQGIAQFMPATAARVGLDDPFDPAKALPKSAEHLADLQRRLGNEGLAAAAYNAGEGRVRAWLSGRSLLPMETLNYVRAITGREAHTFAPPGTATPMGAGILALAAPRSPVMPGSTRFQSAEWQIGIKLMGGENRLTTLLDGPGYAGRRTVASRAPRPTTPAAATGEKALCASMGRGCIVASVY